MKYISFILFLMILFLLNPYVLYSQTTLQRLTVTQTTTEARGTVFLNHPDKAGVIIESPLTNLRFGSNMNGIVEENHQSEHGEYILIIEPITQIITIDAPGYMQERIRIGSMAPRDVRYFLVEPEEQGSELISVIFNVVPIEATLFVDDQVMESNRTIQLARNHYQIRLQHEGYKTIEETVHVSPDNIQFNYRLESVDIVPVQILSNVTGAQVSIDGGTRGETDSAGMLGLWLYPGSYLLEIRQSGYLTQTREITIQEEGENRFNFTLDRNVGELALNMTPSDARVSINRQNFTGRRQIELTPGRYRLEVEKDGFEPHIETLDLTRNQRLSRRIELIPHSGSLRFNITPGNAQVLLRNAQGQQVENWHGIRHIRNLPVGSYRLSASAGGYAEWTSEIMIKKDAEERIEVRLDELRFGVLRITGNVSNANGTLYRNGIRHSSWRGHRTFNTLETGRYRLEYHAANHRPYRKNFSVSAGDTQHIHVRLKQRAHINEVYLGASWNQEKHWGDIFGLSLDLASARDLVSFELKYVNKKSSGFEFFSDDKTELLWINARYGYNLFTKHIKPSILLGYREAISPESDFMSYNGITVGIGLNLIIKSILLRGEYIFNNYSTLPNTRSIGITVGLGLGSKVF
jgi:hypothetical protein